ncbi:hypothetical protein WR25_14072 isoform B [Diploscapter pachys]|uniref:Potassium channel domain-containing protein n=1 Tax=Diploscapter pachys TaxID=2018661 RepID=A0A2A2J5T8_9BILA|nr:hypothetical protein WR25_14072 isoform B [Diploscapter pachys]
MSDSPKNIQQKRSFIVEPTPISSDYQLNENHGDKCSDSGSSGLVHLHAEGTPHAHSNSHAVPGEDADPRHRVNRPKSPFEDIYESELEYSSCDDESMTSSKYEGERNQKRGQRTYSESMPSSSQENRETSRNESENSQAAIEKYYERNQFSVTGRNQDTFNKLPLYMRKRNTIQLDAESRKSNVSSPGVAQPATPVPRSHLFKSSLYWLAHNHRKVGFRHLCLTIVLLTYTFGGALMFYLIESAHERETVQIRKVALEETLHAIAVEMTEVVNNPSRTVNVTIMEMYTKRAYTRLLAHESLYQGSTFYKLEDESNYKWTFFSAIFFCMNLYTTTGYGIIATDSTLGKWLTIVYGFMFVPLTLIIIRDFGQFALVYTTKIYARVQGMIRKMRKKKVDEDDMVKLPLLFCNALMVGYMMCCTVFVYLFDAASGPPSSGITFFHAFYFSFISISTIGLGDIAPNNVTFNPIITLIFFLGMPIMKVVNRVTYVALENGVFGTLTVMENKMDRSFGAKRASVAPTPQPDATSVLGALTGEEEAANEMLNNLTIRSIATFMKSDADVYGGAYGRVSLRRGDLYKKEDIRNSRSNKSVRSNRSNQVI